MKKIATISFVAIALAAITSCSYLVDFAIINNAEEPIQVEYYHRIADGRKPAGHTYPHEYSKPKLIDSSAFKKGGFDRDSLEIPEHSYDKETGMVKMELLPGKAVLVARMGNYTGTDNERYKWKHQVSFLVARVRITASRGHLEYEGIEVLKAFKKISRTKYALEYR